ncbi:MAG TPA: ABC transporter ATP-binding protein [Tepidisphaeraceae bacterium]|nr:ABC transporter ATP-binding protein [Tepidisphaeraceae bacterium]
MLDRCRRAARVYARAASYFRPDFALVGVLFLLTGASAGLGLLMAWPMAVMVDAVLTDATKADAVHRAFLSVLPSSIVGQIAGLALIGLSLKLAQDTLGNVQRIVASRINYAGLMRVRFELFNKLQHLSLAYHRTHPQGDALYRLNSDTYGPQTILGVLMGVVIAAVTLAVVAWILWTRHPALTLVAFSITPLLAAANVVFGRRLKAASLRCRERDSELTTAAQRAIANVALVQAFGREGAELERFHGTARECVRAWWRLNFNEIAYNTIIGGVSGVGGAAVFGYGAWLAWQQQFAHPVQNGFTVGDLLIFTSYLGQLWGPLCTLTGFVASIQGGAAATERVFEVLDRDNGIHETADAVALPLQPRTLSLHGVGFEYASGQRVLRDVDATLRPGEMVAFVGSSGAGKSTLLNLLPRFYDPTAGAIHLDGVDVRQIKLADLRRHVAIVSQENLLLPTTIGQNIAYGRPEATAADVRAAAAMAGAAAFIDAMPAGYDTPVAEGGANLSGGQRQRIAIARALLTGAPVIVLDEPTSALDPRQEQHIVHTLRALKGHRTIVLVSHRMSAVVDCDQIFVMDQGRVAERGTHAALIARDGLYADMVRRQLGAAPIGTTHETSVDYRRAA